MEAGLGLRWLRAAILSFVTLVVGAAAHTSAGGLLPGPTGFVVIWLLGTAPAALVLGRPAPAWLLSAALAGGQMVVHALLSMAWGHRGEPAAVPVLAPSRSGAGLMANYEATRPHVQGTDALSHLYGDFTAHADMALLHLLAAVAVGLWLACGERALWAVLGYVVRHVLPPRLLLPVLVRPAMAPARWFTRTELPLALDLLTRSVVRRGPPALLV